jgi:hypothetical protein
MTPTEDTTLEEELALGLDKYVEQLQVWVLLSKIRDFINFSQPFAIY